MKTPLDERFTITGITLLAGPLGIVGAFDAGSAFKSTPGLSFVQLAQWGLKGEEAHHDRQ